MNRKVLIQISLFLVVLVACFIFYRLFFKNPEIKLNDIKEDKQGNKILLKQETNQIKDIVYNSNYSNDNKYTIKAEFGQFNKEDPDLMLLTNVKGTIILNNYDIIKISSDKAIYNSENYNTNFYKNVLIIFEDHRINSDNFDLSFDKKISTIYNNVIYKNLNTTLRADKIDIDLITKDSKIYMMDKSKKVKIKSLN
jgi:lipopolysaccharide assembly outer membrane protein LptD (OstA)